MAALPAQGQGSVEQAEGQVLVLEEGVGIEGSLVVLLEAVLVVEGEAQAEEVAENAQEAGLEGQGLPWEGTAQEEA